MMPYNRKYNVLSASLNKHFLPSLKLNISLSRLITRPLSLPSWMSQKISKAVLEMLNLIMTRGHIYKLVKITSKIPLYIAKYDSSLQFNPQCLINSVYFIRRNCFLHYLIVGFRNILCIK